MSSDESKPFEPSQKKLEDARRRGDIVKSTDLVAFAVYLGILFSIYSFGSFLSDYVGGFLSTSLHLNFYESGSVFAFPRLTLLGVAGGCSLIFFGPILFSFVSLLLQRAFVFAPSKLEFKLSRISPISNAKQKFGISGIFEFLKTCVKLLAFSSILCLFVWSEVDSILGSVSLDVEPALAEIYSLSLRFLLVVVAVSLIVGCVDYLFQFFEHRRRNRMSFKDLTDENKESEGDPFFKNERQARARQIASGQMLAAVSESDVMIVNPQHYAVALKWSRQPGSAPVCVAKGVDFLAKRMREEAARSSVPIHQDPPTARALYASTEVLSEVDPKFYRAVAEAIRFADEMRNKVNQRPWS